MKKRIFLVFCLCSIAVTSQAENEDDCQTCDDLSSEDSENSYDTSENSDSSSSSDNYESTDNSESSDSSDSSKSLDSSDNSESSASDFCIDCQQGLNCSEHKLKTGKNYCQCLEWIFESSRLY
jgi:hypothetical protein